MIVFFFFGVGLACFGSTVLVLACETVSFIGSGSTSSVIVFFAELVKERS